MVAVMITEPPVTVIVTSNGSTPAMPAIDDASDVVFA